MPFLKYLNVHARGRYASPAQPVTTPSELPGRVTIGELSNNQLLNIFRYYLDVSPQHWPRLVHICRRWRRIVFGSQRTLHLRIFCTHGTPVLKTLRRWPAIPIVVQYGGPLELGPPAPKDEDNVMAALKQSGRVSSISLTVTSSLLEKLSSIERPFLELENLVLSSQDGVPLTLPSSFRWGSRLRCLHSTRIAIPLIQLLCSSTNLVDLRLHEVFDSWQLPIETLTNALSGMVQLRSLSLHFISTVNYTTLLPKSWGRRAILPVLTRLDFRGITGYLERLVARIDAPYLGDIELTLLNEDVIDFPIFHEFIDRIEMHKSHSRAHILSSDCAITIALMQSETPACLKLELFCESSSKQLLFMTRVCAHLSASLSNVEDLCIRTARPSGWGDSDYSGWRDILNSFTGVKWFHLDWDHSITVMRNLQLPHRRNETVRPSLHVLYTPQPGKPYGPLGEAVISFMTSRQLSGHHLAAKSEQLCYINELRGTGPHSQRVTTETLSDDVLLNIFCHHLDAAPRTWPALTYVCQRWRHIVHTSPLGLNLRLYFTPGTPVLKALDCWPALPIVVQYGGFPNTDPPAAKDDDNIIVALKHSGRINSVNLTVTGSLLEKLPTISEPFSELEELVLLSQDNMQLTLPSTFRWGPHLRTLHSSRIAFPSFPQLLSPSNDLANIQLHEIPSAGYFSPEAFANALSGMIQLETLSLHFLSLPPRRNYLILPPLPGERVVLPALRSLKYRGTSKYLDSLVARIDAPGLRDIDITFFSQPTMDASQLGRFIERTGIQTTLSRTEVQTSKHVISISFTDSSASTPVRLQISCKQLDWQLSSMAQVCDQFSPFLFRITNIRIDTTQPSSNLDDADSGQWLQLIRAFGGATDLPVADELTTAILCALGLVDEGDTNFLPDLRHLHIENPMAMDELSWDCLLSFITLRSRSGHPVQANVTLYQCHICHASFREQEELHFHLVHEHTYRRLCSYCRNFERTQGRDNLFREHLKNNHSEAWLKDAHIWNASLTPLQLDSLVTRHSFLCAPDTAAPSVGRVNRR